MTRLRRHCAMQMPLVHYAPRPQPFCKTYVVPCMGPLHSPQLLSAMSNVLHAVQQGPWWAGSIICVGFAPRCRSPCCPVEHACPT